MFHVALLFQASNDSGKGGSEMMTTPPSLTPAVDSMMGPSAEQFMLYETEFPHHLVGRLIGRNGSSIKDIKDRSGARITVRKFTENSRVKICAVEGNLCFTDHRAVGTIVGSNYTKNMNQHSKNS